MYKASLSIFLTNHILNWKEYHSNVEQISKNQSNLTPYGISAWVTALHVRLSQFKASHGHWNLPCIKILRRKPWHYKTWLEFEKYESETN